MDKSFGAAAYRMRAATVTAMGAAAARAKLLAEHEEREMQLLMASIIEAQVHITVFAHFLCHFTIWLLELELIPFDSRLTL